MYVYVCTTVAGHNGPHATITTDTQPGSGRHPSINVGSFQVCRRLALRLLHRLFDRHHVFNVNGAPLPRQLQISGKIRMKVRITYVGITAGLYRTAIIRGRPHIQTHLPASPHSKPRTHAAVAQRTWASHNANPFARHSLPPMTPT